MKNKVFFTTVVSVLTLTGFLLSGCLAWKWTSFEWGNEIDQELQIVDFKGFSERVAPGWVRPYLKPTDVQRNYGDPVRVDKNIMIRWKIGNEEHEQVWTRAQSGLSKVLNGVTVRFIYQTNGTWRIEQLKGSQ